MQLIVTDLEGARHKITGESGESAMEAIMNAGLDIAAHCGGCCICSTCHVYVDSDWLRKLPPRTEDEESTLELVGDLRPSSRLSCQIQLTDDLAGLRLHLAEETR